MKIIQPYQYKPETTMWVARNGDNSLGLWSIKPRRPERGPFKVWQYPIPTTDTYHFYIDSSLFPDLTWEDEPVECNIVLCKHLVMCPECGKRIWFNSADIHHEHSEQPWDGYTEEWDWLECPGCGKQIEV